MWIDLKPDFDLANGFFFFLGDFFESFGFDGDKGSAIISLMFIRLRFGIFNEMDERAEWEMSWKKEFFCRSLIVLLRSGGTRRFIRDILLGFINFFEIFFEFRQGWGGSGLRRCAERLELLGKSRFLQGKLSGVPVSWPFSEVFPGFLN